MSIKGYITINGTTIHSTRKAVLFDVGLDENKWVPMSAMEDWPNLEDNGDIIIQERFAKNEGLI